MNHVNAAMMKVLILGGDGMLGHQLLSWLRPRHEVRVTLHQTLAAYRSYDLFDANHCYDGIDVRSMERLVEVLADFRPDAVVNCAGIVKQRPTAKESIPCIEINALLPHRLSVLCKGVGARLVHMSTDCVFSGKRGCYKESDLPDAEDLYGKTKFLGEVHDEHCLTLRTSIIGRELARKGSLLEWFLAQRGEIQGFTKAVFSGFTTRELSRIIEKMLVNHPEAHGLYHVSSEPISKYQLLLLLQERLGLNIKINPEETFCCDRSLDSTRFRETFSYSPPAWEEMVDELKTTL